VVEGEVFGSLYGQEDVSIRQSGKVQGNIVAPRVTLEDGSTFRGSIDMRSPEQAKPEQGKPEQAKSPQASNAPAAANAKPSSAPSNQAVIPGKSEKSA
jgi:cytoskeletal protein CcmA (bactofilin family)